MAGRRSFGLFRRLSSGLLAGRSPGQFQECLVTTARFSTCSLRRGDDPKTALKGHEARQIAIEDIGKTAAQLKHEAGLKSVITVEGKADVATSSGVPEEHIHERYVRVFRPAKYATQSGTAGVRRWRIEFETRERWENSLMGWASSGDPLSNTIVDFSSKEEAIEFVEKNNWPYWVEDPKERAPKAKSYALNFAWNKRTRKSTK